MIQAPASETALSRLASAAAVASRVSTGWMAFRIRNLRVGGPASPCADRPSWTVEPTQCPPAEGRPDEPSLEHIGDFVRRIIVELKRNMLLNNFLF